MHRCFAFALLLNFVAASTLLHAGASEGDPRKEKLFTMFIAPCCWRGNLDNHSSPKVDELRAEIERQIAAGRTDEQIKQDFIERYSIRILAEPEGAYQKWLSWTPILAVLGGIAILGYFIRRSIRNAPPAEPPPAATDNLPDLPETEWS